MVEKNKELDEVFLANVKLKKHTFQGEVISKKMEKTATVLVKRVFLDKKVKKIVTSTKKFHVHDPLNATKIGDFISFYEGPHISKIKYMYLSQILKVGNFELEEVV